MSDVVLLAPIAGWLTPLEEVPDPVFAERMMGDGVAIDPIDTMLRAPADATVISIPETAHAATLRLANGAELLIHVGLETVALAGKGFRALSSAGSEVKAGDALIELDLDSVARGARSLVTPIVVASDGYALELDRPSRRVAVGEPIGTVRGAAAAPEAAAPGPACERTVRIAAPNGLHARPAARIAALLRPFQAEVRIGVADRSANARSTVALLGLGVRDGDELRVTGQGPQREAAVAAVVRLIAAGLGEAHAEPPAAAVQGGAGPVCASPGLAVGKVVQFRLADLPVARDGAGAAVERRRLADALQAVAAALIETDLVAAELGAAHRELLSDPDLIARAEAEIDQGRSAAFAWRTACEAARDSIRATGDRLLIERAADLMDLERRVIAVLAGESAPAMPELPPESILVAPDLLPSQLLAIDKSRLAGICTAEGGPTSHVAILAASAGIPMLVAAGPGVLDIPEQATAIIDADHCRIESDPSPERLEAVAAQIAERRTRRAAEARDAKELCFTSDGTRIEVFANLGSVEDAHAAVAAGAEGCGLLRTEFLFLDRDSAPDKDEQQRVYGEIAAVLGSRPLIVRTLDLGADKSVPYVAMGAEENPALGLRGIRLSFARPDLLATQLAAIVAAAAAAQIRIMLPMVTEVGEVRQVRRLLDAARQAAGVAEPLALGVMIETPAAAALADSIAAEADFLSVGTNDLTQYVLAADRGNAAVSAKADALHPAVLRLIRQAADGARKHERWIGVCGGLASDPLAAAILIGLGVTELSVAPAAVPTIKAAVRHLRLDECRALAERACAAASAHEVRMIAAEALE
ncbi:MAG TPA: phosphoenolpyruvate--protein phosphotransferase [Sphingomicrobium sp.]